MCGGGGTSTTVNKTEIPEWLEDAAQYNIQIAQDLADRDYQTYDQARIAPFSADQLQAFDMIRNYGSQFAGPTGYEDAAFGASQAPIMQYDQPLLLDMIPGQDGTYGLQDYMNPYVDAVLQDTIANMTREAGVAQQGLDNSATMAGAFGDARHGVQSAEMNRNLIDLIGQQSNRTYADAFNNAAGLMSNDIDRLTQNFGMNAGLYEGGLDRMMSGAGAASNIAGNDLANYMQYVNALNAGGAQQQMMAQSSADLGYQDFLNEWNYPVEMLNVLNQTTSMQPHGSTSTQTSTMPSASPFSQIFGAGLGLASLWI